MGKMIFSMHLDTFHHTFGLSKIGCWILFDDCLALRLKVKIAGIM